MFKEYSDQDYYENEYITTPQMDVAFELAIAYNLFLVVLALGLTLIGVQ